jgi:hypothetical protein
MSAPKALRYQEAVEKPSASHFPPFFLFRFLFRFLLIFLSFPSAGGRL